MKNIAYIMRGVPGSGKSTVARQIAGDVGVIHSTDSFLHVNGEYKFDPKKLKEYHEKNFEDFKKSIEEGKPIVICDNTNIQRWEFEPYQKIAEENGYIVAIVSMPHPDPEVAEDRTEHSVPAKSIQNMINRWEE